MRASCIWESDISVTVLNLWRDVTELRLPSCANNLCTVAMYSA